MKHYGDITQLSGYELPVVDCIVGGSPCQDLSVAGKRAGLDGERSGLFMEQVRLLKEMREADVRRTGRSGFLVRPRFLIWENVGGAFSSGNPRGADFQAVLEELCKVVCKEVPPVPIPKEGWPKAGCISGVGDSGCTFSISWRLHDAQFWGTAQFVNGRMLTPGTPQRRKRIALVADFGGLSAPEILFERKGLSWHSEQSEEEGQGTAKGTERCIDSTIPIEGNGSRESHRGNGYGSVGDASFTLNSTEQHAVAYGISAYDSNAMKSSNPHSGVYKADTARTLDMQGGSPACNQGGIAVMSVDCRNATEQEVNGTLQTKPNGGTSLNLNNVVRVGADSE